MKFVSAMKLEIRGDMGHPSRVGATRQIAGQTFILFKR
jgi:hypothetical protein